MFLEHGDPKLGTMFDIALRRFEEEISSTDDVFVSKHQNTSAYLTDLETGLRASMCAPFKISARVTEAGFEGVDLGDTISGTCIAEANGYWLVYQPEWDSFVVFWGTQKDHLGAPGIEGSPLACWSS